MTLRLEQVGNNPTDVEFTRNYATGSSHGWLLARALVDFEQELAEVGLQHYRGPSGFERETSRMTIAGGVVTVTVSGRAIETPTPE